MLILPSIPELFTSNDWWSGSSLMAYICLTWGVENSSIVKKRNEYQFHHLFSRRLFCLGWTVIKARHKSLMAWLCQCLGRSGFYHLLLFSICNPGHRRRKTSAKNISNLIFELHRSLVPGEVRQTGAAGGGRSGWFCIVSGVSEQSSGFVWDLDNYGWTSSLLCPPLCHRSGPS